MAKKEILFLVGSSALPAAVREYFARVVTGNSGSALKEGLKKNPAAQIKKIDFLLAAASGILGVPKEEVLFVTGFNKNDMAPERFEAAMAELRAVVFLQCEGFSGLRLIGQAAAVSADIYGEKNGRPYVFEVCCRPRDSELAAVDYLIDSAAAPAMPAKKALKYLQERCREKERQMNSSRKQHGCERCGLIIEINPRNFTALSDEKNLKELAEELHNSLKWPGSRHICVLGNDGVVFPEWPSV